MRKHRLKAFGLAIMAALGLMAVTAVVAQAENLNGATQAHTPFLVLGSTSLALNQTVTGEAETTTNLLLVPNSNVEIKCEKFTVLEGVLLAEGDADARVLFEKCTVNSLSPLEALPCEIIGPGNVGHITAEALLLSILHAGVAYVLAEPKVEPLSGTSAFSELKFKKGTGCLLPNPIKITGSVAFNTSQTHVAEPLISAGDHALQLLLGDLLAFGVNDAFIDGSAKLKLTSATHKGCTWGGV